jgi:hypothetical protein
MPDKTDDQTPHAAYAPSSLGHMEKCPGFRNRKGNKTEASERGDRVHAALEKDNPDLLPEAERPVAQMCKDVIDEAIASRLPQRPDKDIRERKGTVGMDFGGEISTFGTPDRLLIYGDYGLLYDYKSGYREVTDAETNAQVWSYVIGILQKHPYLGALEAHILIPNRDEILSHVFTQGDLPRMKLRLNTIIRRAMEIDWSDWRKVDETKLSPGPELCEYCEFQTICPALARKHLHIASQIGDGLPIPKSLNVDKRRPGDIAKIMRLVPLLEDWAKRQRAEALRLNLEENVDIPGFKRMTRKTDRTVTSVPGAWEAVKGTINWQEFLSICSSVSVPQLENVFKAKAVHGQKAKSGRDLECKLRDAGVWVEQGEIFYLKEQKK